MKFGFNVSLSDDDYLDYNKFWMIKSPYGKKQITSLRIVIILLLCAFILLSLIESGFTVGALVSIIPLMIVLTGFQIFLKSFLVFSLKGQLKSLKKKGKMGYSPQSVIEFYDDCFVETTPDVKTEQKYSAIERVSIIDNKIIYIHINNVMAYLLPISCFESKEQYEQFFEFIKTKCKEINIY